MESLGILRSLWRHPIAVAIGAVLAFAVGAMAHYEVTLSPPSLKSRAVESGYAQEHVLVDTQTSLLVDAQAKDAESISTRAIILSDLLADDAAKKRMAREAGVQTDEIAVVGLGTTIPDVGTPLAERATEVVKPLGRYRIDVSEGPSLPILSILVSGPDRGKATRLAEAATGTLSSLAAHSPAAGADLRIEQLGSGKSWVRIAAPGKLKALIAGIAAFVAWSIGIVAFDRFQRRRSDREWAASEGVRA